MKNLSFGSNDMAKIAAKQATGEKKVEKEESTFSTKDKASVVEKIGKDQLRLIKMAEELYSKYPTTEIYSAINSMEEVIKKFETISEKIHEFGG